MNQKLREGGPVFPFEYTNLTRIGQPGFFSAGIVAPGGAQQFGGMTMRQHYAGLAMQGMVSSIHNEDGYRRMHAIAELEGMTVSQWIARDSFKQADAMLAAGEQQNELERLRAERNAMARAILDWWHIAQHEYLPDEPAFVTQAIELGIDP